MSKILINGLDIDISQYNLKLIKDGDIGLYGKVYRLNDKECLKIYDYNTHFKNEVPINMLLELSELDIDCVINPKKIIISEKELDYNKYAYGYIMNYIDGKNLNNIDRVKVKTFLEMLSELFNVVKEISKEKLVIQDCHLGNLMLPNDINKIHFIDIDNWHFDRQQSKNFVYKTNFEYVNHSIMIRLLSYKYDKIEGKINEETDIIDFYSSFIEKECKEKRMKIKTIRDLKNMFK